jgi:kynurenine formamidase
MDERVRDLVDEYDRGLLTRRGFLTKATGLGLSAAAAASLLNAAPAGAETAPAAPAVQPRKWRKGHGWGWVWGPDDQVGSLNELSPELARKALSLARTGRVYDLGMTYERRSYRWPGHSPGEIMSFRTPAGELLQRDLEFMFGEGNTSNTTFTNHALFISDNVATQLDGYAHISEGDPPHTYNGVRMTDIQGDWGLLKFGVETIPPIVAPATLIDVARSVGQDPLPAGFAITPELLQEALERQRVDIDPLDVVLIRTGTGAVWLAGDGVGADHEALQRSDTAGINLSAARWLVEEKGAIAIGSDTSGLEVTPPPEQLPEGTSFNPVHVYMLVRQGVHILEYNNLEDAAADRTYKFAYVLGVNKIKGTAAGTVQRPLGLA